MNGMMFRFVGSRSISANYTIAAILRDIWRTEQRQNRTIAVELI
jgi:hypothetical protein